MSIHEKLESVRDVEGFITFIHALAEDLEQNPSQWANTDLADYLNGIASWVEDRYEIEESKREFSEGVDWDSLAFILFVGSRYE
ncbi:hypothetical protein [Paenibacillus thiaminolyticus]|uniref:DUF7660 domain-containing protein n=1 Tax=Paenibacillus thiaminolyticus TaxID=49283 RepID=A0A3A3GKK1_PANTH|nr:hypothetical protein [Paenibacillus thiaminolyticus]RJG25498.1 hypothetical protein DQX05_05190 [Paenibacillus thiaminolyticus]